MNNLKKIRKERALTQKIKLIETFIDIEGLHNYIVTGETNNIHEITMQEIPKCTCLDFTMRNNRCKHIYFILIKILNINPDDEIFLLDKIYNINNTESFSSDKFEELRQSKLENTINDQNPIIFNINNLNTDKEDKKIIETKSIKIIFENVIDDKFKFLEFDVDIPNTIYNYIQTIYGVEARNNAIKYFEKSTINEIMEDNNFEGVYVTKVNDNLYELNMKTITKINNGWMWMFNNYKIISKTLKIARFIIILNNIK